MPDTRERNPYYRTPDQNGPSLAGPVAVVGIVYLLYRICKWVAAGCPGWKMMIALVVVLYALGSLIDVGYFAHTDWHGNVIIPAKYDWFGRPLAPDQIKR